VRLLSKLILVVLPLAGCRTLLESGQSFDTQPVLVTCPDAVIHAAFSTPTSKVVSGCSAVARVEVDCAREPCSSEQVSFTRLEVPKRLESKDKVAWVDPSAPAESPVEVTDGSDDAVPPGGKRLTDLTNPDFALSLPPELNRRGQVLKAEFRVCVSAKGEVTRVNVVSGVSPALDASWVAKLESWRYQPWQKDGLVVPWCAPLRLQLAGVG
jgi:hypothetical protein